MATTQAAPQLNLEVRRIFAAPRERVFAAWTQREQYSRWMCKVTPESKVECLELDVRPGGRFAVNNISPTGAIHQVCGEFKEVLPPQKIVFTWQWQGPTSRMDVNRLVTVEFFERGDETELVLTHTGFLYAEDRDRHGIGWNGCFNSLAGTL